MDPWLVFASTFEGYKMRETLVVKAATTHYQSSVLIVAKESMQSLEEEVKITRAYREDDVVDDEVGEVIPNLGCSRNKDTKFHRTMEMC